MVATINQKEGYHPTLAQRRAGLIASFTDERMASKLMSMGVLPGSRVELVRRSPFGGSWYAKVDNLLLALRQEEVDSIVLRS